MPRKASLKKILPTVDGLDREPGHLYFIDKEGDLAKRRRNPGHHPSWSVSHENKKVRTLGINKQKGWLYYLDGKDRVVTQPMRQFAGN